MKVYQVMLCTVHELKNGETLFVEGPIGTFDDKFKAEKEREICQAEIEKKEKYDRTKEWFTVKEWYVH